MDKPRWLVLSYSLPCEPSKNRVAVWRALKKLGAANIQQSMWVLPANEENYAALLKICSKVEEGDGDALLMQSMFFEDKDDEKVASFFIDQRSEEYGEFISACEGYLNDIVSLISAENFSFSNLEQKEAQLERLILRHGKLKSTDVFKSEKGNESGTILEQAKLAFEGYSEMVYKKELARIRQRRNQQE